MKILFVSSGNNKLHNSIVLNQADSISETDATILIEHYRIIGKGFLGYLKNLRSLRKKVKVFKPDIIHSHYSLSGFLAVLSCSNTPIVASLMGSDVQRKGFWKKTLLVFSKYWKAIIVKSSDMKIKCGIESAVIIPNGVNFSSYANLEKVNARKILKLDQSKRIILFLADPNRPEKNFKLAEEAYEKIKSNDAQLSVVYNVPHNETSKYYYASDVVFLSSTYEGSPNVIKEAMACNKAIVTTKVGDVELLLNGLDGCFVCQHDSEELSRALLKALSYRTPTLGRERLKELGLDSSTISKKIISIYKNILN